MGEGSDKMNLEVGQERAGRNCAISSRPLDVEMIKGLDGRSGNLSAHSL